ncbi:alkene reductase [Gluconobacter albidus]|uniref:Alkene reductase n=1 Tax=Gluconobacter albidus TaxID=318683 RepID=A0AAW3QYJ9_9PROT|nr:alkene reductase [Gluconobacter albidus]KXV41108.1 NADH:flavin oxidoreductase [Gluconobacter albidus]MCP1274171.1 alkene reductase [Gluconobacter albidus]GLQ70020.1 alkene reductase [Gluconobacter albidus]
MADLLFSPKFVGPMRLEHRIIMAPLTRMRSSIGNLPNDLMLEYYTQRATPGGLLISEASPVALTGYGFERAAGIYDDAQIPGWKRITDAVHAKGGRMFLQLWHVGRQSARSLQPGGAAPLAPSAIRADGTAWTLDGPVPYDTPRALELNEISSLIEAYRQAATRALQAGFDGVEIHGANGYLPDQFLQDGTNTRTDAYGGPIENRARFLQEITQAAIDVWGADRVGVRLTPSGSYGAMSDSNRHATFSYVASMLQTMGVAYLHIVQPRIGTDAEPDPVDVSVLRPLFSRTIIAAGGFTSESAEKLLESGDADLIAFGRAFIANPDLVLRLRNHWPLNRYDRSTFYGGDFHGYTDYPTFSDEENEPSNLSSRPTIR